MHHIDLYKGIYHNEKASVEKVALQTMIARKKIYKWMKRELNFLLDVVRYYHNSWSETMAENYVKSVTTKCRHASHIHASNRREAALIENESARAAGQQTHVKAIPEGLQGVLQIRNCALK